MSFVIAIIYQLHLSDSTESNRIPLLGRKAHDRNAPNACRRGFITVPPTGEFTRTQRSWIATPQRQIVLLGSTQLSSFFTIHDGDAFNATPVFYVASFGVTSGHTSCNVLNTCGNFVATTGFEPVKQGLMRPRR